MKSSTAGFRPCCIQDCELVERVSQLPNIYMLPQKLRGFTDIYSDIQGFEKTLYSDAGDDDKELVLNAKYRLCRYGDDLLI